MPSSTDRRRTLAVAGSAAAAALGLGWVARSGKRRIARERADLFDHMLRTMDEERATLAHHLHDGPQQTLTAVRLMTGAARDAVRSGDQARADEVLTKLDGIASEAADELRRTTARLHPVVMAQQGLVQALGSLAETVREEYGVAAEFHAPPPPWEGEEERDSAIYRIAREAAVNAARHGRPPVDIRLARGSAEIVMRVDDAGGSLNGDSAAAGIGMRMMRERATRIGAELELERDPDRRTSVVLRVPVASGPGR
jgi:signal transduction histidine kinase